MGKLLILFIMIFLHIIDDYYLQAQGVLASMKQREWWVTNAPDEKYKYDYLVALFMHSFSWTFMITLPIIFYVIFAGGYYYPLLFLANIIIHFVVDDLKANKKKINLIQDQIIHMIQIVITWLLWLFVY